eukprot:TRINITY_DN1090_c3_g1_i1.p1 TRINITY_DN1090_c3_g1~~TRINITY_DN1090_c3_g1_i1.p1  ORF type:complete len:253 (+),score=43.74 TRINITY_DN1090_c3_g1_i1:75-761(+)
METSGDGQPQPNGNEYSQMPPPQMQQQQQQQPPPYGQVPPQQLYAPPPQYPGRSVVVNIPIPTTNIYGAVRGSIRMGLLKNYKDVTGCQLTNEESSMMTMYQIKRWSSFMIEMVVPLAVFVKTGPTPSEEQLQQYTAKKNIPPETVEKMRSVTRFGFSLPLRLASVTLCWGVIRSMNGYMDEVTFNSFLNNYPQSYLHNYAEYLENEARRGGEHGLPYVPHPPIPIGY